MSRWWLKSHSIKKEIAIQGHCDRAEGRWALVRARRGQTGDRDRELECRHRPDPLSHQADDLVLDRAGRPVNARLSTMKPQVSYGRKLVTA